MSPPSAAQLHERRQQQQQQQLVLRQASQRQQTHTMIGGSSVEDPFLARLGYAEGRDSARTAQGRRAGFVQHFPAIQNERLHRQLQQTGPVTSDDWAELLDWREAQGKRTLERASITGPPANVHPRYLTEQQQQQLAVQEAHQQALARNKQKEEQDILKQEAMARSGALAAMQRASSHSSPSLAARTLSATSMAAPTEAQKLQHSVRVVQAHAAAQTMAIRAANAAVAQGQAIKIARQEEMWRDPRGRAFRV